MRVPWRRFAWLAVLIVAATGCALTPRDFPPTVTLPARSLIDLDAVPDAYKPFDAEQALELLRADRGTVVKGGPRRKLLALSGGGMYGAYTAGVLKGWTASGARPKFDVVTGVSTGALIAPFAFLGPEYDDFLHRRYTSVRAEDILKFRNVLTVLWADAVADSWPLRSMIASEITPDLLDRIARAHAEGRRLYVGTTNLDNKRLIVWDMGAIAAGNRPGRLELFRSVILASCSFPGVFPPVAIDVVVDGRRYTELHGDGEVASTIFLETTSLLGAPGRAEVIPEADVYAILASKLHPDPASVRRRLLSVTGQSLVGIMQGRTEGDLVRLYLLARLTGGRFQVAAIPQAMRVDPNPLTFNSDDMRRLFDVGYEFGASGRTWRATPPGAEPDEQHLPRSGVHFATVPGGAPSSPPGFADPVGADGLAPRP